MYFSLPPQFHCDEALACALLTFTNEFGGKNSTTIVVRSRDSNIWDQCDLLCDVGAVYDPTRHRYDHHQSTFQGTLEECGHTTRLSSSGLIYKHFGREILRNLGAADQYVDLLYGKVYEGFMEHIDAIDNGIEVADGPLRYKISSTLSNRVSRLNPSWQLSPEETRAAENVGFTEAMRMTGQEFVSVVRGYIDSWIPARAIVEQAMSERLSHDANGEIIVLSRFCPWKDHLLDIEREQNILGQVKYCLFQDTKGSWRVQCVGVEGQSFQNRLSLPAAWCGVRDGELDKISGISGCIFVHASGFIGGNATFEGALQMAQTALKQERSEDGVNEPENKRQKAQ